MLKLPNLHLITECFTERNFINFCIFMLLFFSILRLGQPISLALDPSWTAGLGYAFAHNFQAGVDYVFTFGPFGYNQHFGSSYLPDLYIQFIIWQFITAFILASLITSSIQFIQTSLDKFLYITLFIIVGTHWHLESIFFTTLCIGFIFAIQLLEFPFSKATYFKFSLVYLLFIIIGLGKFAFFIWMVAAVFSLTTVAALKHSWQVAVKLLTLAIVLFLMIWISAGQQITNIPAFIINSYEISNGYSEAMSTLYLPWELTYAAIIWSCLLLLMGLSIWQKGFDISQLAINFVILCAIFLLWKGGFVRQGLHTLIFFVTVIFLVFFIEVTTKSKSVIFTRSLLRYIVIYCALAGSFHVTFTFNWPYGLPDFIGAWNTRVVGSIKNLFNLPQIAKNSHIHWMTMQQQHDLPKIRAVVGQSTVDIFSWEQSLIFLNGFNWHPRPVFQSYTVYTKKLIEINKTFFFTQPPEFVILKLQAIDFQFPLANDAESYKILLQNYEPVLQEKGYLLLKHHPNLLPSDEPKTLLQQQIYEGEWLDISQFSQQTFSLSLDMPKSPLGKLYIFLYRLPEIFLETRTTDNTVLRHRLIPRMAETGFVYNPLILTQKDFEDWYKHEPLKQVQALRIVINPPWIKRLFKPEFGVQLTEFKKNGG